MPRPTSTRSLEGEVLGGLALKGYGEPGAILQAAVRGADRPSLVDEAWRHRLSAVPYRVARHTQRAAADFSQSREDTSLTTRCT